MDLNMDKAAANIQTDTLKRIPPGKTLLTQHFIYGSSKFIGRYLPKEKKKRKTCSSKKTPLFCIKFLTVFVYNFAYISGNKDESLP